MKIGGREVNSVAQEVVVLTRANGGDIPITAQAVLDMSPFEAMCPVPVPKQMLVKGGFKANTNDPGYSAMLRKHGDLRFAYIAIKSLEPSQIEWTTVSIDDPSTWENWEKELREDAKFSSVEVNRIVLCIMQANSLDERKLKVARENFLHGLEATSPLKNTSGPQDEPQTISSGEPASDSESSPQE